MNINVYTSNVAQLIKVQICSLSEILVLINKLSQSERNELINKRLTTDMYDLKKQFQVAIDHIIYGVSRILELPINSKKYNDDEITTILEFNLLKANNLIDNLIFNVQEHNLNKKIVFVKDERKFEFVNALVYFQDWVIPNVYFHSSMVYAIARMNGLKIGKSVFLNSKNKNIDDYKNLELFPSGGMIYDA